MGALESAWEAAFASGQNPTQDGGIIILRQGYARSTWGKVCWWLMLGEVEGTPQWPLSGTTSLHEQLCLAQPTIIPAAAFHADSYWAHQLPGLVYLGNTLLLTDSLSLVMIYVGFQPSCQLFPSRSLRQAGTQIISGCIDGEDEWKKNIHKKHQILFIALCDQHALFQRLFLWEKEKKRQI